MLHFGLSFEQEMIVDTVRQFVENEIYPHEAEVERTGEVPLELGQEIRDKCIEAGYFAANISEEFGGGGLGHLDFTLLERELGRASNALAVFFGRPSGILQACNEEQREKYLFPAVKGEKFDALAMTEPGAGSDVRGMKCNAKPDGDDWIVTPISPISSSSSSPPAKRKPRAGRRRKSPAFWSTAARPVSKSAPVTTR